MSFLYEYAQKGAIYMNMCMKMRGKFAAEKEAVCLNSYIKMRSRIHTFIFCLYIHILFA